MTLTVHKSHDSSLFKKQINGISSNTSMNKSTFLFRYMSRNQTDCKTDDI